MLDPRYAALGRRVFQPERRAAGLSATEIEPDPRRSFRAAQTQTCSKCRGSGAVGGYTADHDWDDEAWACNDCNMSGLELLPATERSRPQPREVAALAADPAGVARAEACARAFSEGLREWGGPTRERVVWRVGGPLTYEFGARLVLPDLNYVCSWLSASDWPEASRRSAAVREAFNPNEHARPRLCSPLDQAMQRAQTLCCEHASWADAAARGLEIPGSTHPLAGRRFADVDNPFDWALELWLTGYALDAMTDDALLLVAPSP